MITIRLLVKILTTRQTVSVTKNQIKFQGTLLGLLPVIWIAYKVLT
jgi:hypothetical protein